ncbi:MAG: hypothetical protein NVSMB21_04080 [Vulcanimicrobiaceae bacterium]
MPRILQADRVEQAARDRHEPRRVVAQARMPRDRFEHDAAESREIDEARVLFTRAVTAAAHQRRRGEREPAEVRRERRPRVYHRSSCAQKTGPSRQIRACTYARDSGAATAGKYGA